MLCSRAYLPAFVVFLRAAVLRAGFAAGAASAGFSSAWRVRLQLCPSGLRSSLGGGLLCRRLSGGLLHSRCSLFLNRLFLGGSSGLGLDLSGFSSALGACFARSFTSEMVHSWSSPQSPARSGAQRRPQYPCPRCRCTCRQPHRAQADGAGRGRLHLPHLGSAAHVLPQVEPGAVCGAGHHQVDELAGGAVADTVTPSLADESHSCSGLCSYLPDGCCRRP